MKVAFAIGCNFSEYEQELDENLKEYDRNDGEEIVYGEIKGAPVIIAIKELSSKSEAEATAQSLAAEYHLLPESILTYYLTEEPKTGPRTIQMFGNTFVEKVLCSAQIGDIYVVELTWEVQGTGWEPFFPESLPPTQDNGADHKEFPAHDGDAAKAYAKELCEKYGLELQSK